MNQRTADLFDDEAPHVWNRGTRKRGRPPRPCPRTRGENFQHWRMRHGVSAGDMTRAGSTHDDLALMFRFERGTVKLSNRALMPIAHAVLKARDRTRIMAERDHAVLSLAAALAESRDMRAVALTNPNSQAEAS